MKINEIYEQLTNIKIEQQKQLWDSRGKGYYGEFLVFCELYKNIHGVCKILMNLNIPTEKGNTTEIDLILIHETGIYVFEIKHYKGTIYGDDTGNIWTQYFRTTKNNTFKNPILQNTYHINALKNIFKDLPMKSVIVFTNHDCDIRVKVSNPTTNLCSLYNLNETLEKNFKETAFKLSIEEIDEIFNSLAQYSQMKQIVLYNGKEESFISWLEPTIQKLEEEKRNLSVQILQSKKKTIKSIIITIIIIISCILTTIFSIKIMKSTYNNKLEIIEQNYNTQLEKFKQNFKHVDEINNDYITKLNEYFSVSDIEMNELSSNATTFTAKISKANDTYGMLLTEEARYIVITDNGKVYEYNVFGNHLKYSKYYNMIGKGIREHGNLVQAQFHGVTKNEIKYIKITDISLFKLDISKTIVKENLELELYSKN